MNPRTGTVYEAGCRYALRAKQDLASEKGMLSQKFRKKPFGSRARPEGKKGKDREKSEKREGKDEA